MQCLQFDDHKIVSGSWDTTCIVSIIVVVVVIIIITVVVVVVVTRFGILFTVQL